MASPTEISAADDEELNSMLPALTIDERSHLQEVLQRAEEVLRQEEWRKVHLRSNSNINVSLEPPPDDEENCNTCASCGAKFMWLINPGKECENCERSFCKNCTKYFYGGTVRFCNFCFVDLKYRFESGAWFISSRKVAGRTQKFAIEELRDALTPQDEVDGSPRRTSIADLECGNGGAIPSILVNDNPEDSSGHKSKGRRLRQLFHRKHVDSDGAKFSDPSDDSSCLDSRSGRSDDDQSLGSNLRRMSLVSQESLVSLYSSGDENFTLPADMATGDVQLSMQYDLRNNLLVVSVRQCRNLLPQSKSKKSSDPYVKVYLLPDKTRSAKRKTSYKKNTVNPVYNEQFKFAVDSGDLHIRSLWVTVWHSISIGRNTFLGEVNIPLTDVDLNDPAPRWFSLHEKREIDMPSPHLIYKGDLTMAVKHIPTSDILIVDSRQVDSKGELHVWIKDAKNLIPTHTNGYSNPFVKVVLLPDKKSKRKTAVIRNTLCPSWNKILRFENVAVAELAERSLEITVWDHSRIGSNEFLGGVRLNLGKGKYQGQPAKWMNASGYELTLWRSVIQRSSTWIEGTLSLRAHMD